MEDYIWTVPNCKFKDVLIKKIKSRGKIYINLFSKLEEFNLHVSQELRQINELFPEYTPHDTNYHISNLFRITDEIISKSRFELMNASELFILALSLYAHDWGMAVSKSEMHFIITGKCSENSTYYSLIPNEKSQLNEFLKRKNINLDTIKSENDISLQIWCEYIRETHALRSSVRAYNYFKEVDGGIADAVSKICLGHWLNIEEITENNGYYRDSSVIGENVNIKALTIYVRLIDLFDLGEDRTPYTIWKYINPQNEVSKIEWEKHRALRPITCASIQGGRMICVRGSTDDHRVYAALEDLKITCNRYFRESIDALAYMNDSRHMLDIYHIDWRIEARGFNPILIQFQFDREKTLDILSSEIYGNNPYTFARELLQNSIDAIKARKSLLVAKKAGGDFVGNIKVKVDQLDNGDYSLVWNDNGIGMDEFVVKNYFSTIGKSYYNSTDIDTTILKIDPISKFGIGILSCFMVSNNMDIVTYRDQNMYPPTSPLHISIPDIKHQFRIETLLPYDIYVGTTIKFTIDGRKFNKLNNNKSLELTNYLARVAGFVQFPILVEENKNRTIIINADHDKSNLDSQIAEYKVYKTSYDYPFSDVFFPQDLEIAKNILKVKEIDLKTDLGIDDYEGKIILLDIDGKIDLLNLGHGWPTNEIEVEKNGMPYVKRLRWNHNWASTQYTKTNSDTNPIRVYNDGVLIENEHPDITPFSNSPYKSFSYEYYTEANLPVPMIIINIPHVAKESIAISRTTLNSNKDYWGVITDHYADYQYRKIQDYVDCNNAIESLYYIAKTTLIEEVNLKYVLSKLKPIKLPFIDSNGILTFEEMNDKVIYTTPETYNKSILKLLKSTFLNNGEHTKIETWNYSKSLIIISNTIEYGSILHQIVSISKLFLKTNYYLDSIAIENVGRMKYDIQDKWVKIENKPELSLSEFLNCIKEKNYILDTYDYKLFENYVDGSDFIFTLPKLVKFPLEYQNYAAFGTSYLNLEHPLIKNLVVYLICYLQITENKLFDKISEGNLVDSINAIPFFNYLFGDTVITYTSINKSIKNIENILLTKGIIDHINNPDNYLSSKDFIPNSIKLTNKNLTLK